MKKVELLSPAGSFESLIAAIEAGCDAVYLGGKMFGARSYSNNFTNEELIKAINYAHLYGVRVYVTVNTLIYENEVDEFMQYVDYLYKNNVDALIVQDIGMMDLIRKTYPLLELHASTQMHIHNLEGAKLIHDLGLKRVVLARETNVELIEYIKKNVNIELEIFIHGALCISYSGQCLMSSLIGGRSGNRGSCAGSCRLPYDLVTDNKILNKDKYLLSSKDLNTLENIGKLIDIGVDSFKIEGRMKSPAYVYMVTKLYRKAIDSYLESSQVNIDMNEFKKLMKIFNREYTKGFLFNAPNDEMVNEKRPNHLGVEIGRVTNYKNNFVEILLNDNLHVQDGIRIIDKKDIGFTVTNIYKNNEKVKHACKGDKITLMVNDFVSNNSKVVKTTDYLLNKEIEDILKKLKRKVTINIKIQAKIDQPLKLEFDDGKNKIEVIGDVVQKAINQPITKERIMEQASKLGDTIYQVNKIDIVNDENIFISIKELNELRRDAVDNLNKARLSKNVYKKEKYQIEVPNFPVEEKYSINLSTIKPYELIKNIDFDSIYLEEDLYHLINDDRKVLKLNRVIETHNSYDATLLVGELGSLKYQNICTDWSLNVVNSYAVAFLHSHNVKKITLSYELDNKQINDIINNYRKRYHKNPNLELIIYGKEEAMILKYNINEKYNVSKSYLKDRFNNLYPVITKNNLTTIYNYKSRFLENYKNFKVNNYRIELLDENESQIKELINKVIS